MPAVGRLWPSDDDDGDDQDGCAGETRDLEVGDEDGNADQEDEDGGCGDN